MRLVSKSSTWDRTPPPPRFLLFLFIISFICSLYFCFYLLIYFTIRYFLIKHGNFIYEFRPCWIWMHIFICFSVVQFLTLIFSLSLRSIYSVTLVPGYKSCENNDNMSHDMTKLTQWVCAQRCPGWSESWRNLGSLATHWAHTEDSDQTGRMPRLIWVFAGRTLTLLVLLCRGSIIMNQ